MSSHVLAIDEGGSGVRAYVFDHEGRQVATAYSEISVSCPRPSWVEHDPNALWERTLAVTRSALEHAKLPAGAIAALGLCNQRASALVWDGDTGAPIYPAIGWQDLRTVDVCTELGRRGYILSPLQSATKFAWVLENVPGARARADAGRLRFGTIDTWLTWQLSGGASYVTDDSNASCTGVYDFVTGRWDEALLESLRLPVASFPTIVSTSAVVGSTAPDLLGAPIPLAARAGDQQAAMFGQLRVDICHLISQDFFQLPFRERNCFLLPVKTGSGDSKKKQSQAEMGQGSAHEPRTLLHNLHASDEIHKEHEQGSESEGNHGRITESEIPHNAFANHRSCKREPESAEKILPRALAPPEQEA